MAFIGNQPALSYTSFAVQHFTTSATTSYTLNYPVANENEIRLVINNVVQQPGSSYAYTASGTSLTLSAATTVSDTMYAVFLGKAVQTVNPPNGSVGTSQLANGAVTSAKLASGVGGKVLQVVQATTSTNSETSSTSFVTTGLSASITPSSTSNKILAMCSFGGGNNNGASGAGLEHIYTLYRNSTDLGAASSKGFNPVTYYTASGNAPILYSIPVSINYLDSPSTTSSTTYEVYFRVNNASYGAQFCRYNSTATIILMEIAG